MLMYRENGVPMMYVPFWGAVEMAYDPISGEWYDMDDPDAPPYVREREEMEGDEEEW